MRVAGVGLARMMGGRRAENRRSKWRGCGWCAERAEKAVSDVLLLHVKYAWLFGGVVSLNFGSRAFEYVGSLSQSLGNVGDELVFLIVVRVGAANNSISQSQSVAGRLISVLCCRSVLFPGRGSIDRIYVFLASRIIALENGNQTVRDALTRVGAKSG